MVTQAARASLATLAIGDFAAQTHADRELVIVHDGDADCGAALAAAAAGHAGATVRIVQAPPGLSLGALRNRAVAAAHGAFVCQWDDDDRYHPQRLALQLACLREREADFCFLVDQLHWFQHEGSAYWDDWDAEPYPLNLVQGTLLGRCAAMPVYPDAARGEDTALLVALLRAGHRVARLRDAGWCYVYVHHGANAWDLAHHAAISNAKRFGAARLLAREHTLRQRLAEYRPPLGPLRLPHEAGELQLD